MSNPESSQPEPSPSPSPSSNDPGELPGEGAESPADSAGPQRLGPGAKLAVEAGPLVVFFLTNSMASKRIEDPSRSIFYATGAFMAAIVVSLIVSWRVERRIPPMAAFTAVFVLIFGGLTIYLQNDIFIKVKSTIINVLLAGLLGGGLATGRLFLKTVMGEAIALADEGWRILTIRWIVFFLVIAVANEIVWRNYSNDTWVSFKSFGILPLTVIFSLLQLPLMQRYQIESEAGAPTS